MSQKTEIKRKDDNSFELKAIIPAKKIRKKYQEILKEEASKIEIKGFRKGQAPLKLVEEKVDKNKVRQAIVQEVVGEVYSEAVREHNLKPIIPPSVSLDSTEKDKDWRITISSCELPKIDLGSLEKEIKKNNAKDKIWTPGKKEEASKDKIKKKDEQIQKLIEIIVKTVKINLANILIEYEMNRKLVDLIDQLQKVGMKIDQYLTSKGINLDQLKEQYRQNIEVNWKVELVLEEIADRNKIIVSSEDLKKLEKSKLNQYLASKIIRREKTVEYLLGL